MKKIDWPIDALVYELYGLTEEVEKMLALHKQLPEAATPHERTALQRPDRGHVWADRRGPGCTD